MALSRPIPTPIVSRATCLVTDDVGKCVRAVSNPVGDVYDVTTVAIDDWATMPAVAVIIEKYSSTECRIQFLGPMRNVVSGHGVGRVMFVDDDGGLTETPPIPPPGDSVFIQAMGVTLGDSVMILNPSFSLTKVLG